MRSSLSLRERPGGRANAPTPAWVKTLAVMAAVFVAVVVVLHLSGHGMRGHGTGSHGVVAPDVSAGTERGP